MSTSKTASTCAPEAAEGTHVFDILEYSRHSGLGVGADRFIRSGAFSVGGYDWAVRFYPDGLEVSEQDYVAVYLELLSKGDAVRASCDLRLVDRTTGLASSVFSQTTPRVFNPNDETRFAPQSARFKKRSELEGSGYILGDRLTIECVVTVFKEPRVSETKLTTEIEVPPSDILEHLGKLLEAKEGADVTFDVGGEAFAAHRIVLAMRSPIFKAELYGHMKEKDMQRITIDDIQPAVFGAMLHFIYTDSLPSMDDHDEDDKKEMVQHLLVAADRYALERLKLMCERILSGSLDVHTVATTLYLADQHNCSKLKDACAEFIISSSTKDDVLASQGYKNLKRTNPTAVLELTNAVSISKHTPCRAIQQGCSGKNWCRSVTPSWPFCHSLYLKVKH